MMTPTPQIHTETRTTTHTGWVSRIFKALMKFLSKDTDESSTRLISVSASWTLDACLFVVTSVICYRALKNLAIDPQLAMFAGGLVVGVGGVATLIGRHKEPG